MVNLIIVLLATVIKHLMAQMRQRRRDQDKTCSLGTSLVPYYLQQSPSNIATSTQLCQQVTSPFVACSMGRVVPVIPLDPVVR